MFKFIKKQGSLIAHVLVVILVVLFSAACEREDCEEQIPAPERLNVWFYTENSAGIIDTAAVFIDSIYLLDISTDSLILKQASTYRTLNLPLPLDRDSISYVIRTLELGEYYDDTVQVFYNRNAYMKDPTCGFKIDYDSVSNVNLKMDRFKSATIDRAQIDTIRNATNIKIIF